MRDRESDQNKKRVEERKSRWRGGGALRYDLSASTERYRATLFTERVASVAATIAVSIY